MKPITRSFSDSIRLLSASAAYSLSCLVASAAFPAGNLLVNGSGQAATNVGWTIIAAPGDGWARIPSGGADAIPGFFATSYSAASRRSQLVDLLATGATEAELDQSPAIRFSEFISTWGSNSGQVDRFYILVELRGAGGEVLASWNVGSSAALVNTPSTWTKYEHTFTGYPAGVRFVYVEDGGFDTGFWAGHYGSYHDAATLEIVPDSDLDGLTDTWEIANGLDPFENGTVGETSPGAKNGPNGAAGDLDGDGLSNLEEFKLGTRADLKDTDGDGYWDSWEDKFGSWLSSTATGTNPLNPDTDRDGVPDGQEDPDLKGTDPNIADSDGDGVIDGVELVNGSDPLDPDRLPVFPAYNPILKENFDGDSTNSTFAFTRTSGNFTPVVSNSAVPANGNVAQLAAAGIGGSNNSIAWNAIPANANSIRLSFDFSLTAGADGIGIGFFKTATYGETGASNPAVGSNWEDPKVAGLLKDAVVLGFRIYQANVLHIVTPDNPKVDLLAATPGFALSSGVFHRAIVTAYRAGPGTTAFHVDLIQDINGAATQYRIATNVVAKDFDIGTDAWRLIAGARTGGVTTTAQLDHVVVSSTAGGSAPTEPEILSSVFDWNAIPPVLSISWSSTADARYTIEQSTTLATDSWSPLEINILSGGIVTSRAVPLPEGQLNKQFFRVKQE